MFTIRPIVEDDTPSILRINAAGVPGVEALEESDLRWLLALSGCHLVAVAEPRVVAGYLLSFYHDSDYTGEEFGYFRRWCREPFLYVDQVAIAPEYRKHGAGRCLYDAVTTVARRKRIGLVGCEVNIDPPNPASLAFHQRLGFSRLNEMTVLGGRTVALFAKSVGDE